MELWKVQFEGIGEKEWVAIGQVMMEWAMVETLTRWSISKAVPGKPQDENLGRTISEKLKCIERHSADPTARDYAAAVRECVEEWQVERHSLAHGMVVVGKDGKWMETDKGETLPFEQIPLALDHAQTTSRLSYVLFLHLCGETVTDKLLDQPVIRVNEGERVKDFWELKRLIAGR